MLTVGITGGIGSGKTVVANVFRKLGIPVFFSDIVAAKIILRNKKVVEKIRKKFGEEIFFDNILDRKKLAQIVFSDKKKLALLNSIVHPAVRDEFGKWKKKFNNFPFVIYESAILFETGRYEQFDFSILVTAPENLRIQRVMKRDKVSADDVLLRMKNQWSDAKKKKIADAVIVNDEKKMILPQALKIYYSLKQ